MEKIGELLKELNIFKDMKIEYNAATCVCCGMKTVTVINDNNFGICSPCHVDIENEKMRNKFIKKFD